ncbi:MAG: hypothetical protein KGL16_09155, partial [Acidobacteriota bacterium]|nr:hypothetical protein [Acidobacteriota bacterium]
MFSDTFAGIAPASVPGYAIAQLFGGALAVLVIRVLYPDVTPAEAAEVVIPHGQVAPEQLAPQLAPEQLAPEQLAPERLAPAQPPHQHSAPPQTEPTSA